MLTANLPACAALALAVLLLKPVPDAPAFACKAGVTVQRTLTMKGTRELTRLTDRSAAGSRDRDDFHWSFDLSSNQVVRDEVRSCAGPRVAGLARTYVTLEKGRTETVKSPTGNATTENPETSDLAGKTVVFAWDADKKAYTRTIDGAPNENPADKNPTAENLTGEKLTADLEADMDYLAFLPAKDAPVGAKWDVDFADVKTALLRPGGDIPFHGEKSPKAMDRRLRQAAWDATKGKLSLELGSTREVDGRKLVTITFRGDMSYDALVAPEKDEKGPRSVHVEDVQKVDGKLVWDVEAGRAQGIEWTSKGTMKLTVVNVVKQPDGTDGQSEQALIFDEECLYTGKFELR
jgi:hypothetical protein